MAIIEGTRAQKTWTGDYDFAVDGGAVSTITLRSADGPIPNGSIIDFAELEVLTGFTTSAGATGAVSVESAGDLVAATIVSGAPFSTTGFKATVPVGTAATTIKTTAARSPTLAFATGAATAGKMRVHIRYK